MDWWIILAWVFTWGLFFPGIMYGQVFLVARYSWKETGDPETYFRQHTLVAIRSAWSRRRVLWTIYFACLFVSLAAIVSGSLVTLGVTRYLPWPVGATGAVAIEIGAYKSRRFLSRTIVGRMTVESWRKQDTSGMLGLTTAGTFAVPAIYLWLAIF